MDKRAQRRSVAALAAGMGLLCAGTAAAQGAGPDPRWHAWIGCWEPVAAEAGAVPAGEAAPTVCIAPAARGAGVEVVTVVGGEVVERAPLDAGGQPLRTEREGCVGTETAEWSADGYRLFRHTAYTCSGAARRVDGLMALSPAGEWLDVQHLTAAGEGGVRVIRYRAVERPAALPAELAAAVEGQALAARTARLAAASRLTTDDVLEASRTLQAPAVEAWLLETGQGFALEIDGERLVALADAGVPAGVIDMLVALSYPERFAIDRGTGDARLREEEGARQPQPRYGGWTGWGSRLGGWSGYYPGYGYDYYGYYGGYYGRPIIVVRDPDEAGGRTEGRVVKGRGYTRTRPAGDGGSTARPSGDRGYTPSSGDSGRGGGSGRTAKPRS